MANIRTPLARIIALLSLIVLAAIAVSAQAATEQPPADSAGLVAPAAAGDLGWTTKASMPNPRTQLGVAAGANGKIYAIGGYNPALGRRLTIVEEYGPGNQHLGCARQYDYRTIPFRGAGSSQRKNLCHRRLRRLPR